MYFSKLELVLNVNWGIVGPFESIFMRICEKDKKKEENLTYPNTKQLQNSFCSVYSSINTMGALRICHWLWRVDEWGLRRLYSRALMPTPWRATYKYISTLHKDSSQPFHILKCLFDLELLISKKHGTINSRRRGRWKALLFYKYSGNSSIISYNFYLLIFSHGKQEFLHR